MKEKLTKRKLITALLAIFALLAVNVIFHYTPPTIHAAGNLDVIAGDGSPSVDEDDGIKGADETLIDGETAYALVQVFGGNGGDADLASGGDGGLASLTLSEAEVTITAGLEIRSGTNGSDGDAFLGGRGGAASFEHDGSLSTSSLSITKNDGSVSVDIGKLVVDGTTTITLNNTDESDVNIESIEILSGTLIINNDNGMLSVGSLTVADEGATITVTNPENVSIDDPNIVTQPQDVESGVGQSVSFSVGVDCSTDLSYQWQVSTDEGQNYHDIVDATDETYVLNTIEMEMNGNLYRVVVTNSWGKAVASDGARLTVQKASPTLTLSIDPEDATIIPNMIVVTVTLSGANNIADKTIKISINDKYYDVVMDNDGKAILAFVPVEGLYTINASFAGDDNNNPADAEPIVDYRVGEGPLSIVGSGTLTYGDSKQKLSVIGGKGNGSVVFHAVANDVLTVTPDGTVTVIGVGTATVSATKQADGDNEEQTATFDITVNPRDITLVSIDVVGDQIYNGTQLQPTLNISDGTIKITSNDYDIYYGENINAGNGTVSIVGKGNYTGLNTIEFEILKAQQAPLLIQTTTNFLDLSLDESNATITVSGGSVSVPVVWGSSSDEIVSISDGVVTPLLVGMVNITATNPGNENYEPVTSNVLTVTVVDKTELRNTIIETNKVRASAVVGNRNTDFPQQSYNSFVSAIDLAISIRDLDSVTQTVIDNATASLLTARTSFEASRIVVDYSKLNQLIKEVSNALSGAKVGTGNGQYSQSAVDTLRTALDSAKASASDNLLTQNNVDKAYNSLRNALNAFKPNSTSSNKGTTTNGSSTGSNQNQPTVETPVIDKSKLETSIEKAKNLIATAVVGDDPGQYPQAAVDTLQAVIDDATALLDDDQANQDAIDEMRATVEDAIKTFNQSVNKTITAPPEDINSPSDPDYTWYYIGAGTMAFGAASIIYRVIKKRKTIKKDA